MTSDKVSYSRKGFKYFICDEKDDEKVKPLHIILLKMSGYLKCDDEVSYMFFVINDKELLKAYNKILDSVINLMKKN